jgi:hypothetical protein
MTDEQIDPLAMCVIHVGVGCWLQSGAAGRIASGVVSARDFVAETPVCDARC